MADTPNISAETAASYGYGPSDAFINSQAEKGQKTYDKQRYGRPQFQFPDISQEQADKNKLLDILMGAGAGVQAQDGSQSPFASIAMGIGGGIKSVRDSQAQQQAARVAAAQQQQDLQGGEIRLNSQQLDMTPLGQVSPVLAAKFKTDYGMDIGTMPLGHFKQIAPLIQSEVKSQDAVAKFNRDRAFHMEVLSASPAMKRYWEGVLKMPEGSLDTLKASEEANLKAAMNTGGKLPPTPEQIDTVARSFANHEIPAKDFAALIGRSHPSDRYALFAAIKKYDPNFDMSKSTLDFKKAESQAGAEGRTIGSKGFQTTAAVGTLDDVLSKAETYVTKLSPTKLALANAALQSGLAHISDPEANALLIHMNEAQGLYSQILMGQGVPTDQARKMAADAMIRGLDPKGFAAMKSAVMFAGRSRSMRLSGQDPNASAAPKSFSQTATNPQTGQKIGLNAQGQWEVIP